MINLTSSFSFTTVNYINLLYTTFYYYYHIFFLNHKYKKLWDSFTFRITSFLLTCIKFPSFSIWQGSTTDIPHESMTYMIVRKNSLTLKWFPFDDSTLRCSSNQTHEQRFQVFFNKEDVVLEQNEKGFCTSMKCRLWEGGLWFSSVYLLQFVRECEVCACIENLIYTSGGWENKGRKWKTWDWLGLFKFLW